MNEAVYDKLIGSLYEAALDPQLWEQVIVQVADLIGADSGHFMLARHGQPFFSTVGRYSREREASYFDHYMALDPHRPMLLNTPFNHWVANHEHFDDNYVRCSEFYQDYLIPSGCRHIIGGRFKASNDMEAVFAIFRAPHRSPYETQERHTLQRLGEHLQRAINLMSKTVDLQQMATIEASALGRLNQAIVICDANGLVLFANPMAEEIFRANDGLKLKNQAILTPHANTQLSRLLADAVTLHRGGGLSIARPSGKQAYCLLAAPLPPHSSPLNCWQKPLALLLISDPVQPALLSSAHLTGLFHFTAAEARLASGLLNGMTPSEYANEFGLALPTIRSQLKAIFVKTGTRRQAELIRLLSSLQPTC